MSTLRVGVIGLGAMGAPMAVHLKTHGLLAAVYNRTASRALAFAAEHGVPAAGSVADLGHRCNAVLICVSGDADVLDLSRELKLYLAPGAVVVDSSTVAPATAREAAAILAQAGIAFLDAPVSGGVEGARNGKLSVMAGGDAETLERARPLLEAFAARITLMGDVGAGQATKAVNQVMIAGIAEAVCEALALAEKLELDPQRLLPTLIGGAAQSWFLEKRGATMLRDEFVVGFKLALLHKDLGIVRRIGDELDADLPIVDKALKDYAELLAKGHGDDDISGLIRLKRRGPTL